MTHPARSRLVKDLFCSANQLAIIIASLSLRRIVSFIRHGQRHLSIPVKKDRRDFSARNAAISVPKRIRSSVRRDNW
jgi:hypothetical protein